MKLFRAALAAIGLFAGVAACGVVLVVYLIAEPLRSGVIILNAFLFAWNLRLVVRVLRFRKKAARAMAELHTRFRERRCSICGRPFEIVEHTERQPYVSMTCPEGCEAVGVTPFCFIVFARGGEITVESWGPK